MEQKDWCRSARSSNISRHSLSHDSGRFTIAFAPGTRAKPSSPQRKLRSQSPDGIFQTDKLAAVVSAFFDFNLAARQAFWADQHLPRNSDKIGSGKFGAGALVEIVIENVDASGAQSAVKLLAGRVGIRAALLEIENGRLERRDRLRPFYPRLVMERLDDGSDEPAWPNAVRAHVHRALDAVRAGYSGPHWLGIFGPEIKYVPNFNAACRDLPFNRQLHERRRVVLLRCR